MHTYELRVFKETKIVKINLRNNEKTFRFELYLFLLQEALINLRMKREKGEVRNVGMNPKTLSL